MRRSWIIAIIIWVLMTAGLLTWATLSVAATTMTPSAFRELLRETLEEYPEIILDVLQGNSEVILDIAQQGANQRHRNVLRGQWMLDAEQPKELLLTNRPVLGDKDAAVTIVAFSDFTCPYCQQAATTIRGLMEKHAGKVRYIFKHYPLETHGNARIAAQYHIATGLQDSEKSWDFYHAIFASPAAFNKEGEAFLKATAKKLGFDMKRLASDVRGRTVKAILDEDRLDAERLGVKGTPFFLVNNLVIRGALAPHLFSDAINMAYEKR